MKEGDQWIVIPDWDRFQHYSDREVRWVKCYVSLLSKPEYLRLNPGARAVLHGLWLMYASSHRHIPLDTALLSRQLNLRVSSVQLESLNHAGFIEFSASRPLAQIREEKKREEKKEQVQEAPTVKKEPTRPPSQLPLEVQTIYDHWRAKRGRTRSSYDTISPARRVKIQARLKEFSAADLMLAIDGVAKDPWPDRGQHDDLTVIFRSQEQTERFLEMATSNGNGSKVSPQEQARRWVTNVGWTMPDHDFREELGRFGVDGDSKQRLVALALSLQQRQEAVH